MRNFIVRKIGQVDLLESQSIRCVKVHRPFTLGNPFQLREEASRDKVIQAYRKWLWDNLHTIDNKYISPVAEGVQSIYHGNLSNPSAIKRVILDILLRHREDRTKPIALICYCHPKPCHADSIAQCLEWLAIPTLEVIISGGQTGADEAGLRAARDIGIPTGGTAPKNYRICLPDGSDGTNPDLANYSLVESHSYSYKPRTIKNVKDSDGTVWFGFSDSPGGILTIKTCKENNKPYILNPTSLDLFFWVKTRKIKVLNVAGNRLSNLNPTIADTTYKCIKHAFQYCR
jgi:hypothetical protein